MLTLARLRGGGMKKLLSRLLFYMVGLQHIASQFLNTWLATNAILNTPFSSKNYLFLSMYF